MYCHLKFVEREGQIFLQSDLLVEVKLRVHPVESEPSLGSKSVTR